MVHAVPVKLKRDNLLVFPVLRRVRQLEKKLLITEGRLPSVREVLSRFSTRLLDTQDFLLKAENIVQETEHKNRGSILKFQRNEVISLHQLLLRATDLSSSVCLY